VGGGCEAEDYDAGLRIAKTRYRTSPVGLIPERSPLLPGDLLAPGYKTRALTTADDLPFENSEELAVQRAPPFVLRSSARSSLRLPLLSTLGAFQASLSACQLLPFQPRKAAPEALKQLAEVLRAADRREAAC
jgi:hypothetical protein